MKPLLSLLRPGRAHETAARRDGASARRAARDGDGAVSSTDSFGRGMDIALTMLVFLGLGWLIDRWLGVFPVVTIGLTVFAAVGTFVRLKYVYDASMERLEAERRAARASKPTLEDAA